MGVQPEVGLKLVPRMREFLLALGVSFAETADGLALVLPVPSIGGTLNLHAGEIDAASGEMWPVSLIEVPLLMNVDPSVLAWEVIARLGDKLVIGKVCVDSPHNTLTLRHEVVGWPGPAEWRVSIEALIGHAQRILPGLKTIVTGLAPPTYEDIVRAGARRVV